jgi:hypothetical protein
MIVWTIHRTSVWLDMQKTGILRCPPDYDHEHFGPAYNWMAEQMQKRIGPPPDGVKWPVWVWYQYGNGPRRRPDLRGIRHTWATGDMVMMECDIQVDQLLLSHFHAWHSVLGDWHLPISQQEYDAYKHDCPDWRDANGDCPERRRQSWGRIFDIDCEDTPPYEGWFDEPFEKRIIQGTLWEIRLDQVRSVQRFATSKIFIEGKCVPYTVPLAPINDLQPASRLRRNVLAGSKG